MRARAVYPVAVLALLLTGCGKPCKQYELKMVHHEANVMIIVTGDTNNLIFRDAYDKQEAVCVAWVNGMKRPVKER